MAEWWTYSLSSFLMFSPRTYYRLAELYQQAMWPLQAVTVGLALALAAWSVRQPQRARPWIFAALAAAWLWMAWAYHWQRYSQINLAAPYFAAAFALQAVLLLALGTRCREPAADRRGVALALLAVAAVGFPLLALLLGRPCSQTEWLGVMPDATAVATLAAVLLLPPRRGWTTAIVPILWCLVSGATLHALQAADALLPPAAALLAGLALLWRPRARRLE